MKTLSMVQGSPEWHAHRASHFGASEAPAMMGVSRHIMRNELLHMRATGTAQEFSEWVQRNVLDKGHASEAAARPKVEALISDELYPATGVSDEHPDLSASFDGITMDETTGYECKLWNEELAAQVRGGALTDPHYYWQLEQQILVGNLDRVFFVVADENADKFEYLIYRAVPGRRKQLLAGWAQFREDEVAYKPVALPAPVEGRAIMELPSLSIQLIGEVKSSNLAVYKADALAFIESINTELEDDQDFADAEKAIKFCEKSEKELELVKQQALGQTRSIDELFRAVDELREAMRGKRLTLDKLVKQRKDSIRLQIKQEAEDKLRAHIAAIDQRLAPRASLAPFTANFAEMMKGKKTLSSLRDAVDTELARVKIAANESAEHIGGNLRRFDELASDRATLFRDLGDLVRRDADAFEALVRQRLAEDDAAQARLREQIRQQEAVRLQRESMQKAAPLPAPSTAGDVRNAIPGAGRSAAAHPFPRAAEALHPALSKASQPPTDHEIITVLASHYCVHESAVIAWLLAMDLQAFSAPLTTEL